MPGEARPLRLVLDTNVVVAGLLWNGPPRRLLELAIDGMAVELFISPVLLDELTHMLGYAKLTARIRSFGTSISAVVAQYTALVALVVPTSVPRVGVNDADDETGHLQARAPPMNSLLPGAFPQATMPVFRDVRPRTWADSSSPFFLADRNVTKPRT